MYTIFDWRYTLPIIVACNGTRCLSARVLSCILALLMFRFSDALLAHVTEVTLERLMACFPVPSSLHKTPEALAALRQMKQELSSC